MNIFLSSLAYSVRDFFANSLEQQGFTPETPCKMKKNSEDISQYSTCLGQIPAPFDNCFAISLKKDHILT